MKGDMIQGGTQVFIPRLNLVGTVSRSDPRAAGGEPCPCCQLGVSVMPLGDPDTRYGVAPAECVPMAPGPAIAGKGGVT